MSSFDTQIHPEETSEYNDYIDAQELAAIEAEAEAEVGGIASGNRPGPGYDRDWGRSRTDQGIAYLRK